MTRPKNPKIKKGELVKRYQDLLEIARLVSWCMNRDHLIKTCLDHVSQRLGKRARYFLMEGDELKLHCWVGRYECPIEQVPVDKESIVWRIVEKGVRKKEEVAGRKTQKLVVEEGLKIYEEKRE